jgi:hypothetical protein
VSNKDLQTCLTSLDSNQRRISQSRVSNFYLLNVVEKFCFVFIANAYACHHAVREEISSIVGQSNLPVKHFENRHGMSLNVCTA